MKKTRIVVDPSKWQEMDGDNDFEKKINAYLTCRFIFGYNVPSDECLKEAKEIIQIMQTE